MTPRYPRALLVSALVSGVAACSSSAPPAARYAAPVQRFGDPAPVPVFTDPARRAKLEAAFPMVERAIEGQMKQQNVPGLAVAIVIDGDIAYAKGFGVADLATRAPARPDTVYRIGSISKSFTGLAILALRDLGALAIDDPLVRWIPQAAELVYPTRDARPLTLRQMLDHTSGLPGMGNFPQGNGPTAEVIVESLAGLPLDRAPGVRSSYSNLGFALLGIVVSRASHSRFQEVIGQRIWKPLGMTSTYWESEDVPAERLAPAYEPSPTGPVPLAHRARLGDSAGAGGIYSTVEDLARYVAFQLDAYPARDEADDGALRRATLREAHSSGVHGNTNVVLTPRAAPGDPVVVVSSGTYGFGWGREENCFFDEMVGHGGVIDSYRADITFLPSYGVGVVVMSNFGTTNANGFSRLVLEQLRQTRALEPRKLPLDPAFEPAMKQFLGVYHQWDEAAFKAMLDAGRPPQPVEKGEVAGYQALHGTCTGFHALEVMSKSQARIGLTCERGTFELLMQLHPVSRRVVGFVGTSRNVAAPPALAAAANDALVQLSAEHGTCKVLTPLHVGFDWGFELTCERGPGLLLSIGVDPKDPSRVVGLDVQPRQEGMCPVR